ncbi:hypothetical protein [Actinokineospora enzanensis]|uniref:hypothetical protein n=1 Tax=Actinokineospora enzanensis TaxID=155975 RepID=UPI000375E634|nr:hypothetical protein [Actinokineospora enzanensis]
MTETLLGDALAGFAAAGAPPPDVRARRQRLAEFVRSVEPRVWQAPESLWGRLRQVLGWDDESLHAFVHAPMIVHSSTHVSMNAFAPMMVFPWFCLRACHVDGAVHLRTQVTHNNLSDSRWKPHVWWRADAAGRVARTQLFSRGPKFEHQVLLGQPVPDLPGDLCPTDAEAVDLARHATNFAYFAMIYRMALERHAGLHRPGATVEIPIDLMNAHVLAGPDRARWADALHELGLVLREVGQDNKLRELPAAEVAGARGALICPNYINVGQAYRLGISATMGAEKMSVYLAEMNEVLADFYPRIGETCAFPQFLGVSRFDVDRLAPLSESWRAELGSSGRTSLPLVVAQHGTELVGLLDRALTEPVGTIADIVTLRG